MSEEKKIWAKILGNHYKYRKGDRVRLTKDFKTVWGALKKGSVFIVHKDEGDLVDVTDQVRGAWEFYLIDKRVLEPCPMQRINIGDKVRTLKTILCQGPCVDGKKTAKCYIHKGRIGRVTYIEKPNKFQKLIHVSFRGGAAAIYYDWEVEKVGKRNRRKTKLE